MRYKIYWRCDGEPVISPTCMVASSILNAHLNAHLILQKESNIWVDWTVDRIVESN